MTGQEKSDLLMQVTA